ncbi:uncharacterized protein N7496_005791 [Penicillium cataractarum]|uniref:Uncharacterized protein n=1 Tax=Penicillium cataractarum TaxID=2100454 RepID=A0A9W9V6P8_9EURO|nr:uncharacterized protein N7496_005791 [Penicillium cataractarum]KAJ5369699.1 hypothetical protein N7496_005791 [Penicillium cataractarum]
MYEGLGAESSSARMSQRRRLPKSAFSAHRRTESSAMHHEPPVKDLQWIDFFFKLGQPTRMKPDATPPQL